MALREIGARLTLEGEAEWKREMAAADRELQNLKSELAATSAEFSGQANTVDSLRAKQALQQRQTEQQRAKLRALAQAVKDGTSKWGENSRQVDNLTKQYNYARAALANMETNLEDTSRYLEEAENAADGCASSIDEFGKKVKDAGSSASGAGGDLDDLKDSADDVTPSLGDLNDALESLTGIDLSSLATGLGVGAVAAGLKKAYDWAWQTVDETEGIRGAMAALDVAAEQAGMTVDTDLAAPLKRAYELTGDMESSYQIVSDLLSADYSGAGMLEVLQELQGAVVAFPDTVNITDLVDSLETTMSTGELDGQFQQTLKLLGEDTEAFATALQQSSSAAERQDLVLGLLKRHGLADLADMYDDATTSVRALRDAQYEVEQLQATLGETFSEYFSRTVAPLEEAGASALNGALQLAIIGNDVSTRARAVGMSYREFRNLYVDVLESGLPISWEELLDVIEWGGGDEGFAGVKRAAEDQGMAIEAWIGQLKVLKASEDQFNAQKMAAQEQEYADAVAAAAAAQAEQDAALSHASETVDGALERLEALREKYEAIRASVDSAVNGFTSFQETVDYMNNPDRYGERVGGAQDMMDALTSQAEYLESYGANLETAASWGLSESLLTELSDGSTESAEYLANIVAAGEQSVDDFNAAWARVEDGKATFVETVASVLPEFQDTLDEIQGDLETAVETWNMYGDANASANMTMQGYIDGISARLGELQALGAQVSDAMHSAYAAADQQHSPSRRSYREAEHTVQGYLNAFQDAIPDMRAMGATLSSSLHDAWAEPGPLRYPGAAPAGAAGSGGGEGSDREIAELLRENLAVMQDLKGLTVRLDTGETVGALAPAMDNALGQGYSYAGRGLAW